MRQHKLGLCKPHFLDWIQLQTQRFIEKYKMFGQDERILVAVSGGKDSLSLWDVLNRLGYRTDGLYINLGIDDGTKYSARSQQLSESFAEAKELHLHIVAIEELEGYSVPEAARLTLRGKGKPCSVCGLTKRHIMNRIAKEHGYDVVVTGHNLDDECQSILMNVLKGDLLRLVRVGPMPQMAGHPKFVTRIKPLITILENESIVFAKINKIPSHPKKCIYSVDNPLRGGTRKFPYAFTEQGIAMLSSVLNSEQAIQVNIQIMRTFTRLRKILADNQEIRDKINKIIKVQGFKFKEYDNKIKMIFDAINRLLSPLKKNKKKKYGFKPNKR